MRSDAGSAHGRFDSVPFYAAAKSTRNYAASSTVTLNAKRANSLLPARRAACVIPRLPCGTTSRSTGGWSDGARAEGRGYVNGEFLDRARGHEVHGCACKNGSIPYR